MFSFHKLFFGSWLYVQYNTTAHVVNITYNTRLDGQQMTISLTSGVDE